MSNSYFICMYNFIHVQNLTHKHRKLFLKPPLEHALFCCKQQLQRSGLGQGSRLAVQRSLAAVCHRLMDDLRRGLEGPSRDGSWLQGTQ